MMPGISAIFKMGITIGDNVLEGLKLKKEHADVLDKDHLQRFFLLATVLFIYLTMKIEIFFSIL